MLHVNNTWLLVWKNDIEVLNLVSHYIVLLQARDGTGNNLLEYTKATK